MMSHVSGCMDRMENLFGENRPLAGYDSDPNNAVPWPDERSKVSKLCSTCEMAFAVEQQAAFAESEVNFFKFAAIPGCGATDGRSPRRTDIR